MLFATTLWVLILTVYLMMEMRCMDPVGIFLAIVGVFILFLESFIFSYGKIHCLRYDYFFKVLFTWSLYTALGKPIVERYGSLESTFIIMTFGMFMYFPVGFTFAILNDYAVFTINNLIALLTF